MIYEFIVYPHQVCWIPRVTINSDVYQLPPFISEVIDDFTFKQLDPHMKRDMFDMLCRLDRDMREHAYMQLKTRLEQLCKDYPNLEYAFNMHYKNQSEKPHFHVVCMLSAYEYHCLDDFFQAFGMYRFERTTIEMRNVKYTRFSQVYPRPKDGDYLVEDDEDYNASRRLRYLCHLDSGDKDSYDFTDVCANFDYVNDPRVQSLQRLSDFALFLKYKKRFKLEQEYQFYEWLSSARITDDEYTQLKKARQMIHYYYVSLLASKKWR